MTGTTIFLNLLVRTGFIIATSFGLIYLGTQILGREFIFTLIAGGMLLVFQIYALTRYILRIHHTMVSFVDSVGLSSATEIQYHLEKRETSSLESRLNQLKQDLLQSRFEEQKQKGLLEMVVGALDTALICIKNSKDIAFLNSSARKLLNNKKVYAYYDLKIANPVLAGSLDMLTVGFPKVVLLGDYLASIRCFQFVIDTDQYSLYTIHNIQREIESQEIESWKKLIRVLTHEIMNSLGPILSLTKSLKNSISSREKVSNGLKTIENTGEGLIHFLNEYRKLYSLPPPDKKEIVLTEMLDQVHSLFAEECRKEKVKFNMEQSDTAIKLHADPQQLELVLVNLVRNALDSLRSTSNGRIQIRAGEQDGKVSIQVADNGPGIPLEIRDKIFIPFYSTKDKGTGIGLSLSRQIIYNHAGRLTFTSDPDTSTVFTLDF